MIYESAINGVSESEAMSLLENAENRFEYETIAEATAIVVAEQEANWTRFMTGVGLSELHTVMEGQEVIYEGVRLQKFLDKAKAFFKIALSKLAEITKSFIAVVDKLVMNNDKFINKYEKQIKEAKFPSDFSFKGYDFNDSVLDTKPKYDTDRIDFNKTDNILDNKEDYSKKAAEDKLCTENGETFGEKVFVYFHRSKEKVEIKAPTPADMNKYISIIKDTKGLKDKAKESYKNAHNKISNFIKELNNVEKTTINSKEDLQTASRKESAISIVLTYWKAYSNAATTFHGQYMSALGDRNRQAKALCTKAVQYGLNAKGKADRNKQRSKVGWSVHEGFENTDAFLGAVEFF